MAEKVKINPRDAMRRQADASTSAAVDRFAVAQQVTERRPSGLAAEQGAAPEVVRPAVTSLVSSLVPVDAFDISRCIVGSIVQVPLSMIDANPLSPRQIYLNEEIARIERTMPNGQDVAASGYVQDGRVKLIDGGTRLRAARATDRGFLDVRIEAAPKDDLALFERARAFNENRSSTSALDFALSLKKLLEVGAVANHRDIVERIKSPEGERLSESHVSMYMRVSRMPEKLQREMAEEPETRTFAALYAVSEIFTDGMDEAAQAEALFDALEIVAEIKRKKLNRAQITALVKARKDGPKSRERASSMPLDFGAQKGSLKTFGKKGQIELSLSGIAEDELPEVRDVLLHALQEHMRKKKTEA
jgi:ParB family chromosome partitioning protein